MIATANVIAYFDTGFSGIDCPAEPAILTASPNQVTLSVINCLPLSGQPYTSIRVKKFSKLNETDYISLQFSDDNIRYFAKLTGYKYLSLDTVELYLEMDYLLSAGGVSNIMTISGETQRVHVSKTDDKLFKYTEPDELIVPNQALEIQTKDIDIEYNPPSEIAATEVKVIVSTLDLFAIGLMQKEASGQASVLFTEDANDKIVLPKLFSLRDFDYKNEYNGKYAFSEGKSRYGSLKIKLPDATIKDVTRPGVGYFNPYDEMVSLGISRVHECGVEDCIIESYTIPIQYLDEWIGENGRLDIVTKQIGLQQLATDLPIKYTEARNNKIFSGECNGYTFYGMASNDTMKFNPEIIASEQGTDGKEFLPYFLIIDPRLAGGLMCGPWLVNGNYNRWYNNYVRSLHYQNAPITYYGASGSLINDAQLSITRSNMQYDYEAKYPIYGYSASDALKVKYNDIQTTGQLISGVAGGIAGGLSRNPLMMGAGIGQAVGALVDYEVNRTEEQYIETTQDAARRAYENKLLSESTLTNIKNTYVAPQPKFQASETIREIIGNGFCVMKYKMSDDDIKRIDKLLTMYGYRLTKPLELTDLKNRPAFNFIKATDVHITSVLPIPRWLREGVEGQLMGGCRLWHKMYDITELENNETYGG